MTDGEKVPYIQCLYHTGKKVYKYWLATLAAIGIIIALGFIVASAWKQICEGLNAIENFFGSIGYVLSTLFNNAWSLICAVPWYWWLTIGVIAGPFILVAIYCALKHFNVDMIDVTITIVTIVTIVGAINFGYKLFYVTNYFNIFDLIFGVISIIWLVLITIYLTSPTDGVC